MFSRGRQCLRGHLPAILDTVAAGHHEPLLFLYPRWTASALRSRRSLATIAPATSPKRRRSARLSGCSACGLVQSPRLSPFARRWVATSSVARAGQLSEAEASSAVERGFKKQTGDGDDQEPIEVSSKVEGRRAKAKSSQRSRGSRSDGESSATPDASQIPENETSSYEGRYSSSFLSVLKSAASGKLGADYRKIEGPFAVARRNRVKQAAKSPHGETAHQKAILATKGGQDRKKMRIGFAIEKQRQKLSIQGPKFGWSAMQRMLTHMEDNSRARSIQPAKSKEILVSEPAVVQMAGPVGRALLENVWFVNIRNGCRVHVLDAKYGDGSNRRVILSGTENAMGLVATQFRRAQKSLGSIHPSNSTEGGIPLVVSRMALEASTDEESISLVRKIWASDSPAYQDVSAHASIDSVARFSAYIEDLTRSGPQSKGKSESMPTLDEITDRIVEVFDRDSNHALLSSAALNNALEFLCRHEKLRQLRIVFSKAEHVATTESFNILLRKAAKSRDLRTFQRYLHHMSHNRIRPNGGTWVALLQAMVKPDSKASLIKQLAEKGYMDPKNPENVSVIRSVLHSTVYDSLSLHLKNGGNVRSFMSLIEKTHGANWFSSPLLTQMFEAASKLRDFKAVDELIQYCTEWSLRPDGSCLYHLLGMCRSHPSSALGYTFQFMKTPSFKLPARTWEKLFLIAFKGQRFNTCRVLWRYACMTRNVTETMKQTMRTNLSRRILLTEEPTNMNKAFPIQASKVIIGAARSTIKNPDIEAMPSEFHENPLTFFTTDSSQHDESSEPSHLPTSVFQDEKDDTDLRVATALVLHDIKAGPSWQPVHSLEIMLEAANTIDDEWRKSPKTLKWLMDNALQVPVEPRGS